MLASVHLELLERYPHVFSTMKYLMALWACVEQVDEHLGATRDSIYRWIDRKALPAQRIGRLWKFKISEVDDWVR